jgi:hypothetical protein
MSYHSSRIALVYIHRRHPVAYTSLHMLLLHNHGRVTPFATIADLLNGIKSPLPLRYLY